MVSVVLTTHNFENFVDASITSILSQTLSDYELIIVDDGSTDSTLTKIQNHSDPRIEVVVTPRKGAPAAANEGLKRARGRYLAVWDGDDIWRPSKLARHVDVMERKQHLRFTFSWCGLIDDQGRELGAGFRRWRGPITAADLLADFVVGSNSAVLFRREAILEGGGFDETLSHCYDMEACLRLAQAPGVVEVIEEELTLYRRHGGQMSRDWRPIEQDWERILASLRLAAPVEMARVEAKARSNMQRYFAFLAYEARDIRSCAALLGTSLRKAPGLFLSEVRNTELLLACMARAVLPTVVVDSAEEAAVRILRAGKPS